MIKGFWETLPRPFFILAPMADVTDAAFRRLIAKYSRHGEVGGLPVRDRTQTGGPDVFYTEFVSCEGLLREGREILAYDLIYTENERPIVAQIFGSEPEHFYKCARLMKEKGFDGIDINMGCPDKSVEKQGAGAALTKDAKRAREIVRATQEGAPDLPVSVKTRLGYTQMTYNEWIPEVLKEEPAALIMHARTRKEMSDVPAHWEEMEQVVDIAKDSETLVVGNGDVKDLSDARQKVRETGVDGVMLGKAIFGNPWLFSNVADTRCRCHIENPAPILPHTKRISERMGSEGEISHATQSRNRPKRSECVACDRSRKIGAGYVPTVEDRLRVMVEHTKLFEELLTGVKSFAIMKKHYKAYVSGFDGAKELRMRLMDAKDASEVERVVEHYLAAGEIAD